MYNSAGVEGAFACAPCPAGTTTAIITYGQQLGASSAASCGACPPGTWAETTAILGVETVGCTACPDDDPGVYCPGDGFKRSRIERGAKATQ